MNLSKLRRHIFDLIEYRNGISFAFSDANHHARRKMPERKDNEYERVDFFCRLELTAIPSGITNPARSTNLSLAEAGIATKAVFHVGQLVLVTFFLKDPGQDETLQRVMSQVVDFAFEEDSNSMRVKFLQPLDESQRPLVDKLLSR
jgi:hypothetical protein